MCSAECLAMMPQRSCPRHAPLRGRAPPPHRAGRSEPPRATGRLYHLSGPLALARNLALRVMGGERLRARYDWLYDWRPRLTPASHNAES